MDLKELTSGADPAIHWYYQTKKIPLLRSFGAAAPSTAAPWTCLDIGAGSGFFSQTLAGEFPNTIRQTILVDTAYTDANLAAAPTGARVKQREIPPVVDHSFVLLMDVLEHIEDEVAFLQQLKQRSTGNNRFFISVPAFHCVWSYHDVSLGHHRRYTKASLDAALRRADFQIDRLYYIYGLIFPIVWAYRKLHTVPVPESDMKPLPPVLNWLLKQINEIELRLGNINSLCGLTCVAEGRF